MSEVHGHARRHRWTPEFMAWHSMKSRCLCKTATGYKNYGGRGIRVCSSWRGKESFPVFLRDVGKRPSKTHSLDRLNTEGHYSCGYCDECISNGWPMNVKWSTKLEQDNNQRKNVIIEHEGKRLTLAQWARELGLDDATFYKRYKKWGVTDAITRSKFKAKEIRIGEAIMTKSDWCRKYGVDYQTFTQRVQRGMTPLEALTHQSNRTRSSRCSL